MTNFSEYLVQEMLRNVLTWDHTSEQAIIILEKNEELMNKYQTFFGEKIDKNRRVSFTTANCKNASNYRIFENWKRRNDE